MDCSEEIMTVLRKRLKKGILLKKHTVLYFFLSFLFGCLTKKYGAIDIKYPNIGQSPRAANRFSATSHEKSLFLK
jgi:hypothetical protein